MAIKASDIEDRDSLEEWLEGQSVDVARVIAARIALQILPITLSINQGSFSELTNEIKLELTLQVFRASFISWAARNYQTYDINVSVATVDYVTAAAGSATLLSSYTSLAAYIDNVNDTDATAVRAVAVAARAVVAAARADVVTAISEFANYTYITVQADAEWIENNPNDIDALINQPLWLEPNDAPESSHGLQQEIKEKFNEFRKSDLAQDTSFGLICDWYAALLPEKGKPRSLFGKKKDLKLAMQPPEFWQGEAQEVMDRVADLVGWPEDYRKQEDEKTDKDEQAKSEKFSKAKAEKVSSNRTSIRLQLTAILNSVATEVENIGNQPNEEDAQDDWRKKTQFLEGLDKMANDALKLLPIEPDGTQNEKDDEVASLLSDYAQEFDQALRNKKSEVVDWVINLGSAAGLIGLVSLAGGFMPIATPIILRLTCGDKVMDVLRVFKSSSKKKPKDKDE